MGYEYSEAVLERGTEEEGDWTYIEVTAQHGAIELHCEAAGDDAVTHLTLTPEEATDLMAHLGAALLALKSTGAR